MKILVIDDARWNCLSAELLRTETDKVTVVSSIEEAQFALSINVGGYDAVLTDLFMPGANGSEMPAGLVFALKAVGNGVRAVVCTDADHHSDELCKLLDLLNIPSYEKKWRLVTKMEARSVALPAIFDAERDQLELCEWDDPRMEGQPHIKDWRQVLRYSGLFPEKEE